MASRADFIRMTSTTGGTSTLTCSAQTGYPIVSKAFTGTITVDYSISEYTDSTKVTLSKAETGIGSYDTSTEVLTRTRVLSTWDGTNYLPKYGTSTAPSAINFGTTSANIDIMIAPIANGIMPPIPFTSGAVASVTDGLGVLQGNLQVTTTTAVLASGTTYYVPYLLMYGAMFSKFSVRTTATLTGGTPTLDGAVYEVGTNGLPGKRLISFTQITSVGTTNTTYTSTALATPVGLVPGWYYFGLLHIANSASGSFTLRAGSCFSPSPIGALLNSNPMVGAGSVTAQSALNDPATAMTTGVALSAVPAVAMI